MIQEMGFESQGSHFVRRFSASDGHGLTSEGSRRLLSYEIFPLYVDLLVDSVDPKRIEMAGFDVAEELLLTRVLARGSRRRLTGDSETPCLDANCCLCSDSLRIGRRRCGL